MKKLLITLSVLLVFSGCETCRYVDDNAERQRVFKECLELVPEGPRVTHYNDWEEVVSDCDWIAHRQTQEYICTNN